MINANEKLLQLLHDGKIKQEDLDDVDIKGALWDAARLCHSFFCTGHHSNTCDFMVDDIASNVWERESHKDWINKAIKLMKKLDIYEPSEFIKTLNESTIAANTQGPDITLIMSLITFPQMLEDFIVIGELVEVEPSSPAVEQEDEPDQ